MSLDSVMLFDPIELQHIDKIVLEENVYAFRILYAYEPYETSESVYSTYSNIVTAGIQASAWALTEIQKASENDLLPARLKCVDLTRPITREEFAELAVRLYEKTTGTTIAAVANPFTDTTNPEIVKAFTVGITKGTTPTAFTPKDLVTREQCAAMLFRALEGIAPNGNYTVTNVIDFKDQAQISPWALKATQYMSHAGIIKGGSNGNFMPKAVTDAQKATTYGQATREAAILMTVRTFDTVQ